MRVLFGDRPSGQDAWASSSGADAYRLISYADMAGTVAPPADRYEFYGLADAWPARIRLAARIESRLREEGASVWNPPTALATAESPVCLARLLTPDVAIEPALGGERRLPCRLRAAHGGVHTEVDWLESEREVDEVLMDWILAGTDPTVIFRLSTSGCPRHFSKGSRIGDRVQHADDLDPMGEADLLAQLDRVRRDIVAFEYWIEGGQPRLWRVDDSLKAVAHLLVPPTHGDGETAIRSLS